LSNITELRDLSRKMRGTKRDDAVKWVFKPREDTDEGKKRGESSETQSGEKVISKKI